MRRGRLHDEGLSRDTDTLTAREVAWSRRDNLHRCAHKSVCVFVRNARMASKLASYMRMYV